MVGVLVLIVNPMNAHTISAESYVPKGPNSILSTYCGFSRYTTAPNAAAWL